MSKLTIKIAIPVILVGIFAILAFVSISYQNIDKSFYVTILLIVVFVFFSGIAIGQSISKHVKKILSKAVELSQGNLSSRVDLDTKDELAELAKTFNKIAEDLKESRVQKEDIERSIGIKVKAKTNDLEERINALEQKVKNRTIELERLIEESNKLKEISNNK